MDDLVKRLRDPEFGTETTERNLMNSAADRIEELEAELEYWRKDSAAAWDKCEEYRLRIEELEARVAAADKLAVILAAAMHEHDTADYGYGEENPWTMREWFSDEDRAALDAYQATKEGE